MKQGDYARIKVEREGRILEFNIDIPIIPFRLKEEGEGERENKKEKKDKNIQL